jgi:peroxiredoxin
MRWMAAGALVLVLSGSAAADQPTVTSLLKTLELRGYAPGTTPPSFAGQTLDGPLSMPALRGKVVVINFWASWCAECRPEMHAFRRLHRELGPRGFAVVGINAREASSAVRRYATELGVTFPLVLDPDGTLNARYGVVGLPTTFLVGRDGRAVALAVGPREWDGTAARALIEALLAEPAAR